jgi:hypothetical protein
VDIVVIVASVATVLALLVAVAALAYARHTAREAREARREANRYRREARLDDLRDVVIGYVEVARAVARHERTASALLMARERLAKALDATGEELARCEALVHLDPFDRDALLAAAREAMEEINELLRELRGHTAIDAS